MEKFMSRQRIDASELTLLKKLGQGQFGEVWLAEYQPSKNSEQKSNQQLKPSRTTKNSQTNSRIEVALKMRKATKTNHQSTLVNADCFFQEAVMLNYLRHPNIILSYGLCMNYKGLPPILVLEYMNGGNCLDYVKANRSHLTNGDLAQICRNVINGCAHLAKVKVIHKDIGARNVLVRKSIQTRKPEVAKLTDFGLAQDLGKKDTVHADTGNQCIVHMVSSAPECFDGKFSSQSDVWAFGIFVWELYSLIDVDDPIPYSKVIPKSLATILSFLKNGGMVDDPKSAPLDVCIWIHQCLALEPSDRPTFGQLNSAWKSIGKRSENDNKPLSLGAGSEGEQERSAQTAAEPADYLVIEEAECIDHESVYSENID